MASTPATSTRPSLARLEAGSALTGPACVGTAGVAALLIGPLTPVAGAVGAGGSVAMGGSLLYGVAAVRSRARSALVESLRPALAHLIGPPEQTVIKARRWRSGFIGAPTRLRIQYAPSARAHEKEWAEQVRMVAASRLGSRLKVERHDQRGRELLLVAVESAALAPELDADRERAERNVARLLGPTAKVVDVEFADGQVQRIKATFEEATRFATSGHRARIERALSEVMPGRWRGIWLLQKDQVTFEQRPALPECVWVPSTAAADSAHLLEHYREAAVEFAVSEDGHPIRWHPARIPQGLIIGGTGSGKTSTSHAIVSGFTRQGWPVWISDAKRVEFLAFRDYPNVQLVATSLEQQVAMIWSVVRLMEYRYKFIESGQARASDFEPLLVILDEFTEQRDELLDWYPSVRGKIKDTKPPTLKHVARIARKARTARIHLLVLLQRPDAAFLSGEMRDNFGMRASMGRLSPAGALMMWENSSIGVTLPRHQTGRCMATDDAGRVVEAQAYRFPDMDADPSSEQGQLLAQLRPPESRHERLLVTPVHELVDDVDGADFWDYAKAPLVRAADRPDLDPLVVPADGAPRLDPALVASPIILLNRDALAALDGTVAERRPDRVTASAVDVAEDEGFDQEYHPCETASADSLEVGDLVLVDADLDHWAVVDQSVEESLEDPDLVEIPWRDHQGEEGLFTIAAGEVLSRRRPRLDVMGEPLPDEED